MSEVNGNRDHEAKLMAEIRQLRKELADAVAHQQDTQRRFEMSLRGSPVCIFVQDTELRYVSVANPQDGFSENELVGRTDAELYPSALANQLIQLKQRALAGENNVRDQVSVEWLGEKRAFDLTIDPNVDAQGHITGILGCAVDVSGPIAKQEQLSEALRQMSHRTRNQLSVLLSVVRQTSRRDIPLLQFVRRFEARIEALSITQALIVDGDWRSVGLRDLVETHAKMGDTITGKRLSIDGPPVAIAPEPAQNLGLAIHELITNARQSGSLASTDGRLSISWSFITSGDEEGGVALIWRETGGKIAPAPENDGFGVRMIEDILPTALGRATTLDFRDTGLVCRMTIPKACQV